MRVFRFIRRQLEEVLGQGVFRMFRRDRSPAPARLCQFGHEVYSGNGVCSYGHHAA